MQTFEELKKHYGGLDTPTASVKIGGTELWNSGLFTVTEIRIEMSCGEAAGYAGIRLDELAHESDLTGRLDKLLQLGETVSVALGYAGRVKQVFLGYLSGVAYEMGPRWEQAPLRIQLDCLDVKGLMRPVRCFASGGKQSKLVSEILGRAAYRDALGKKKTAIIPASRDTEMLWDGWSDCEMLCRIARRQHFLFYCAGGETHFREDEPAGAPVAALEWGDAADTLSLHYSMDKLVGRVQVAGANQKGERVKAEVKRGAKTPHAGRSLSGRLPPEGECLPLAGASTPETLRAEAEARMREHEKEYATGSSEGVGLPELLPGAAVTVRGAGLGGSAMLLETVHTLEAGGYRTACRFRLL